MRRLLGIADGLARGCEAIAVVLTAAILAVMLAQVYYRYVLNSSLLWSEELALWGLAWLVLLGSVRLMHEWRHVHVPILLLALPLGLRAAMVVLAKAITIFCLGLLTYVGLEVFGAGFHRTLSMLGISSRWAKLAIPVGCGLMLVLAVIGVADDLRAWARGERERFARYGRPSVD